MKIYLDAHRNPRALLLHDFYSCRGIPAFNKPQEYIPLASGWRFDGGLPANEALPGDDFAVQVKAGERSIAHIAV